MPSLHNTLAPMIARKESLQLWQLVSQLDLIPVSPSADQQVPSHSGLPHWIWSWPVDWSPGLTWGPPLHHRLAGCPGLGLVPLCCCPSQGAPTALCCTRTLPRPSDTSSYPDDEAQAAQLDWHPWQSCTGPAVTVKCIFPASIPAGLLSCQPDWQPGRSDGPCSQR